MVFCKFWSSQLHGTFEILSFDRFRNLGSGLHSFDEWVSDNLVFYDGNKIRGCFWRGFEDCLDRFGSLQRRQLSIIGTCIAASLDVTKSCDSRIQSECV